MYPPPSPAPVETSHNDRAGLQIRLLGEFAMEFGGQAFAGSTWQRSHAKRLVQLLCSAPKFSELRGRVLACLWPESEDIRARNRLHHTVHCIRKAWDGIPAAARPQIVVTADRVCFVPGAHTLVDVQAFLLAVESDSADAAERLGALELALDRYRGGLALGWDDCEEIERRRVWLETLREQALQEAVDIAAELKRPAQALRHAHQLALLSPGECTAQCQYALLLADNQRADAALLHCQGARAYIDAEDPTALRQLDDTIQLIQQRANSRPAPCNGHSADAAALIEVAAPSRAPSPMPTPAMPSAPAHLPTQGLVSRLCVSTPQRQAVGIERWVQPCMQCIVDPFSALTSLVGPPGAGKTLVAATTAARLQNQMQHGVLWLDCKGVHDLGSLLHLMADGLDALCGTVQGDENGLRQALHNKELLIVLDGLCVAPSALRLGSVIALAGRDTRWLVTSWSPQHVSGERLVSLAPSQLLERAGGDELSDAARLLLAQCAPLWQFNDAKSVQMLERVCAALDGLPQLLAVAGDYLRAMSPNELMNRLMRDPCALMRSAAGEPEPVDPHFADAVTAWLQHACQAVRRFLGLLSRCSSWLTRADIECLMGTHDNIDALIEHCVRHQFLLRRVHTDDAMPASEFRVPRIVCAALRMERDHDASTPQWIEERFHHWLLQGAQAQSQSQGNPPAGVGLGASRWFDTHFANLDAAAQQWLAAGRRDDLAALCMAHAPHWSLSTHTVRLQAWMDGLGETMAELPAATAGALLMARARLNVHLGQLHLACDDASRALARIVVDRDASLHHQALQLLKRYGTCNDNAATPSVKNLSGRGVEAAESLLRVAQLAVRHGQLPQALTLCKQALEVFGYVGSSYGLIKANHCRAKIAFGLGDTESALRSLSEIERVAQKADAPRELARAALMRAHVWLSQMRFSQAVDLASSVVAMPAVADDLALLAHGTGVVAWAHYGQGAFALAHALCGGLRAQAQAAQGVALRANTEVLAALIEAQSGRFETASSRACAVLELLVQETPLPDTQHDLINGAELAICLGRADLAQPLIDGLGAFASQPGYSLRPWVDTRRRALREKCAGPGVLRHHRNPRQNSQPAGSALTWSSSTPRFSEVLASLVSA